MYNAFREHFFHFFAYLIIDSRAPLGAFGEQTRMRLEWTRRAAAASGGRATPRPEVHARVRPGSLLRGLVAAGPGPRAACRAQTVSRADVQSGDAWVGVLTHPLPPLVLALKQDSVDDVDVDEADVVLEMPHEVEERYLKLLKRQEGKLKDLQRKHSKKRSTHRVMKISSGYLKGSPVLSPRLVRLALPFSLPQPTAPLG